MRSPLQRPANGRKHLGRVGLQFLQHGLGGEHEHAGVPQRAGRDQVGCVLGHRLLDEAADREHAGRTLDGTAGLHVAVCGRWPGRLHAERHDPPGTRADHRLGQDGVQLAGVLDRRVGRRHPDDRLRIGLRHQQRCCRDGRGGVAAHRLEYNACVGDARFTQLSGDQEAVLVVAHDDGGGEARTAAAQRSLHDHRAVVVQQAPELLGKALTRHRPQPRARAAGQDHGNDPG